MSNAIRAISIEREYGCGAGRIARKLAERLNWTLWDAEMTKEIAGRLKCDVRSVEQREEKPDSTFYRLMKIFMRGSYEDRYSGTGTELLDAESLSRLFESVTNDVVNRSPCVIVGRAAPYYLRSRQDVLRLFLYAGYDEKFRRTTERGIAEEEAHRLLETVDRDRAAFVKQYYNKTWPLREIYHLMINSEIGDDAVINLIMHESELLNGQLRSKT